MGAGGIVRAVGTFCLAKKDVSRENKRRNEKERETCWQSRRGEQRRVRGGGVKAAYGGHQPGSRHHQTRHYGGDEEKQTHSAPQPPQGSAIVLPGAKHCKLFSPTQKFHTQIHDKHRADHGDLSLRRRPCVFGLGKAQSVTS